MGGELFCKKEEEEHLEHTPLHLKLRKIVLQNYLIFAHKGISEPSANPGLEEVFLLILSLSLTNSCYRDCTNRTPGIC